MGVCKRLENCELRRFQRTAENGNRPEARGCDAED